MDLQNKQITLEALLDRPGSKAVLQKHFGRQLHHPLMKAAKKLSLAQLEDMAGAYLPRRKIEQILEELERSE